MARKPKQPNRRWRIIHIKGTPVETIGYVSARDAEAALEKAIDEFKITNPQIQQRLVAERTKVQKLR